MARARRQGKGSCWRVRARLADKGAGRRARVAVVSVTGLTGSEGGFLPEDRWLKRKNIFYLSCLPLTLKRGMEGVKLSHAHQHQPSPSADSPLPKRSPTPDSYHSPGVHRFSLHAHAISPPPTGPQRAWSRKRSTLRSSVALMHTSQRCTLRELRKVLISNADQSAAAAPPPCQQARCTPRLNQSP